MILILILLQDALQFNFQASLIKKKIERLSRSGLLSQLQKTTIITGLKLLKGLPGKTMFPLKIWKRKQSKEKTICLYNSESWDNQSPNCFEKVHNNGFLSSIFQKICAGDRTGHVIFGLSAGLSLFGTVK